MRELFIFIYKNRNFFSFVLLNVLCVWLIKNNNLYQAQKFRNANSEVSGKVMSMRSNTLEYLRLKSINEQLASENARLRMLLKDASHLAEDSLLIDSTFLSGYQFTYAKVVNNSVLHANNYITIDKGLKHGIKPGLGVVSSNGIVGQVKDCSENFSTIYSLLHSSMNVSSQLALNDELCTTKWDGKNYREGKVNYLATHIKVKKGDTVMTSGYNTIYPKHYPIGIVKSSKPDEYQNFWEVTIDFSENFNNLTYVYVVKNLHASEIDSLHKIVGKEK